MSFLDLSHQGGAQRALQRAIARERMPHAYIFHGPEGVGKEAMATAVGQRLLCAAPIRRELAASDVAAFGMDDVLDCCGRCEDCRLVAAGTHPDLHSIYRQLHRSHPDSNVRSRKGLELGVDVLRHFLIDRAGMTPARGRAKVFIVREAERMNAEAQNALLKTLEEPPGPSYIILLVTAIDRLLPTTLSRCQVVRFGTLPTQFVQERLRACRPELPPAEADWYARLAGGSIGQAIAFADQGLFAINERLVGTLSADSGVAATRSAGRPARAASTEGTTRPSSAGRAAHSPSGGPRHDSGPSSGLQVANAWIDLAKLLSEHYSAADPEITETEALRQAIKTLLLLAATWYADLLRIGAGTPPLVNTGVKAVGQSAVLFDPGRLVAHVTRIALAERQLDQNAHHQLCLEVLAADLLAA
jgi:DNA polymerase III delta' subunit